MKMKNILFHKYWSGQASKLYSVYGSLLCWRFGTKQTNNISWAITLFQTSYLSQKKCSLSYPRQLVCYSWLGCMGWLPEWKNGDVASYIEGNCFHERHWIVPSRHNKRRQLKEIQQKSRSSCPANDNNWSPNNISKATQKIGGNSGILAN